MMFMDQYLLQEFVLNQLKELKEKVSKQAIKYMQILTNAEMLHSSCLDLLHQKTENL